MPKIQLTQETIQAIETVLNKGNQAEVKIEHGKPEVIAIKRKKVTNTETNE
jgi:transcriptional regulator